MGRGREGAAVSSSSGDRGGGLSYAGQPHGLRTLFFTEMWERFSYYGMRAILVLFMVTPSEQGGLGFTTAQAAIVYGNYTMAVYMLAIPGGFIADRWLGATRAVLIGGVIIALGHFSLAFHGAATFYVGLALVALGTGLLKPSISALVGCLYARDDERRDAGFSIFYMGINIGAFLAPLVTGYLTQGIGFKAGLVAVGLDAGSSWHFGFVAAGIGMVIGLAIFVRQSGLFVAAEAASRVSHGDVSGETHDATVWRDTIAIVVGTGVLAAMMVISDWPGFAWLRTLVLMAPVVSIVWFATRPTAEQRRIAAILVFFLAAMIFWAIFEQAGLSIALFADQLTRNEFAGWPFPSAWYLALNSLFVIMLAPLFAALWTRMGAGQPSSPVKFALGLAFLASSFVLMVPAALLTAEGRVSPMWLVGLYFLQTVGELLLSPVGLSTMTKLAPVRATGLVLGIWFLGSAFGNKLAGVLGAGFQSTDPEALSQFFLHQALFVGLAALVLLALTPLVKSWMGGVR
jgi:POT family proton-dependent oligopeptide transporter